MFDNLVVSFLADEVVGGFFISVPPGYVACVYDRGRGVLKHVYGPGLHLKIPFWQIAKLFNAQVLEYTIHKGFDLGNREKLEDVCVTLGMAYVDSWRLIRKNQGLAQPIIDKLLDQDEIIGDELDVIWQELQKNIKQLTPADQDVWPPLATPNPFYTTEEVAQ